MPTPEKQEGLADKPEEMPAGPSEEEGLPTFSALATPGKPVMPETVGQSRLNVGVVIGGVAPDQLVGKMRPGDISKVIDQAGETSRQKHLETMYSMRLLGYFGGAVLLLIFALSWMFLAFEKAELLEKVLLAIITFASGAIGGFGAGRVTAPGKSGD